MTVEKNCKRYTGPAYRRYLKRRASRLLRRLGKANPECAATRVRDVTRGWSD